MRKKLEKIYMALIFILLYAPIVTLVVLSFNASKTRAKWGGFTLHWAFGSGIAAGRDAVRSLKRPAPKLNKKKR